MKTYKKKAAIGEIRQGLCTYLSAFSAALSKTTDRAGVV